MARRKAKARARRRVAERTRRNALRLEEAVEVEEERAIKLRRARHVEQLVFLEGRGTITDRQRAAGERLRRDFTAAGGLPRVTMLYEPRMARPPRQYLFHNDDSSPTVIDSRARFEKALRPLGSRLIPIVIHVALLDLALADWRAPLGTRNGDAGALLRLALDLLADGYRMPVSDPPEAPQTRSDAPGGYSPTSDASDAL